MAYGPRRVSRKTRGRKRPSYKRRVRTPSARKAIGSKVSRYSRARGVNRAISQVSKKVDALSRTIETKIDICNLAIDNPGHPDWANYVCGGGLGEVHADGGLFYPNVWEFFSLPNGTRQSRRIGNKVTKVSFYIDGLITSLPYSPTTNAYVHGYVLHMVVFKDKKEPEDPDLDKMKITADGQEEHKIDGSILNYFLPYNRARMRIYQTRSWKLGQSPGVQPMVVPNPPATGYAYFGANLQTSRAPLFRRFRVHLPCPTQVLFETYHPADPPPGDGPAHGVKPANTRCSLGFFLTRSDGQAPPVNQNVCKLDMQLKFKYKDA